QSGADGVLYKCTAPNTWTLYYTPYVYPHPLVSGASPTPTPTASPTPTSTATFTPTVTPTFTPTPTPTPTSTFTPTATATATATPSPNQCEVPNFIGTKLNQAQSIWNDAGFTTEVNILPRHFGWLIIWQSLPEGFIGSCPTRRSWALTSLGTIRRPNQLHK